MDKKTAVYICTGCGIGGALDIEKLSAIATDDYSAAACRNHSAFCSPEGVELIKKDIAEEGINTVIIAACSLRVNYDVFDFGPDKIVERVNLREQVVWSHEPGNEDTQMLAEDNLRMGCVKAKDIQLPVPYKADEEYSKIRPDRGRSISVTPLHPGRRQL